MKANHSYEVMQLTHGGPAAHCKEMTSTLPSIGSVGSLTVPVHHTNNLISNNMKNTTNRSKRTSQAYTSQSPTEEKSIVRSPCETDHMYANYPPASSESIKYRELVAEVAQLKELLLFHLDLIQQQSECNSHKDKQLSELRRENDMLRQRLERMERRVILQSQKQQKHEPPADEATVPGKASEPLTNSLTPADSNSHECGLGTIDKSNSQSHDLVPSGVSLCSKDEENPVPKKRIKTLLPVGSKSVSATIANRDRNGKVLSPVNCSDDLKLVSKDDDNILDDLINQAVKEGAIINVTDSNKVDCSMLETRVILEPCDPPVVQFTTDVVEATRTETSPVKAEKKSVPKNSLTILPEHKRIQQLLSQKPSPKEPAPLKKENILTTEKPYFTHVGETHNRQDEIEVNESEVEVPQWCVKPVSGRHAVQGIENLDDEVFSKRHAKHEIDEKRRKRWDLQRIREQRQYEKLRARYEGEDRSQDRRPVSSHCNNRGRNGDCETQFTSLWPQPEDVSHLQVDTWLPVAAFGAPLVNITPSEYTLPWAYSTRTTSSSRNTSDSVPKKRQRR